MKTHKFIFFVFIILVLTLICSSFINLDKSVTSKKFVVVLDAGHGGKDPGNLGNGYREKNIALKIVLEVGRRLENLPNVKVIYTRQKDVFLELHERAAIANKVDADLFISVHCDAHNSQAYGATTYVMGLSKSSQNLSIAKKENEVIYLEDNYEEKYQGFDPKSPESLLGLMLGQEEYLDQSILAASLIQKNIANNLKRKNRKVKQDVFWVLHNTYMPSVLVETGYLTNKSEGSYLNSKKGQTEMAREIAKGILEYKESLKKNIGDYKVIHKEEPLEMTINSDVVFKVQIAASSKSLETKSYNFKGLSAISKEKIGGLYKYFYGNTPDYNEVKRLEDEAKRKGYSSCFIVAYKEGKKVALTEALKSTSN